MFLLFTFTFALFRPVPYTLVTFSYLLISSYLILSLIISSYLILSYLPVITLHYMMDSISSSLLCFLSSHFLILFSSFSPSSFPPCYSLSYSFSPPPPSPLLFLLLLLLLLLLLFLPPPFPPSSSSPSSPSVRLHGDAL